MQDALPIRLTVNLHPPVTLVPRPQSGTGEIGENAPNEANFTETMTIAEAQESIQVTANSGALPELDKGWASPGKAGRGSREQPQAERRVTELPQGGSHTGRLTNRRAVGRLIPSTRLCRVTPPWPWDVENMGLQPSPVPWVPLRANSPPCLRGSRGGVLKRRRSGVPLVLVSMMVC